MSKRKPYNDVLGYVASRKCHHSCGGHIVIYDREKGADIDADARWVVMHEPSGNHVAFSTRRQASDVMKDLASGKNENGIDIYPD